MKVRCEYCKNYIDDSEERCSNCGAVNKDYKRTANQVPTTIDELKKWYEDHHLPPAETTRFFIGVDYKEPRAFGIYKDSYTGKFVVYKNKDDGSRAIRYEGKDEKYAVNELYLKLKNEVARNKNANYNNKNNNNNKKNNRLIIICMLFFFLIPLLFATLFKGPDRGYYKINDREYYYVNGGWYWYNNDTWESTTEPEVDGKIGDYYDKRYYESTDTYSDIQDSDVYDTSWDDSDDWDSDSDWDSSDSWDSGGSDWSSDWFKKRYK